MPQDAEFAGALWSVYFHSTFRIGFARHLISKDFAPRPLPEALQVLMDAKDEHSPVRLRKAVARLVASGWAREKRVAELTGNRELAGKVHQSLFEIADRLHMDRRLLTDEDFAAAGQALSSAPLTGLACNPTPLSCVACLDGLTLRTTLQASVRVDRPLADLEALLDPHCWDACAGSIYNDTYRTIQQNNDWIEDPNPPTCGVGWNGHLIEDVVIGFASFDNRLEIRFWRSPGGGTIRWSFALRDNRDTRLGGASQPGLLTRDNGHLQATQEVGGATTLIQTLKTVAFDNETLSLMAPALLCLWTDNVSEVIPCC
ncbi:MAG: hypothetical protein QNK04_18335 [Myxococcota bacterium]|nr:hypothetical protein [Myxococcota bacterium]